MDDLSEKEQLERIKQWWNEYGWFLLGGAAAAGLGLFGWNQWQAHQDRLAEQASTRYVEIRQSIEDDRGNALDLLSELRSEYPGSPYTHQAALLVASQLVVRDPERAEAELRHVMNQSDDAQLALIARTRLARLLSYQERYEEALALLEVEAPGQFAASVAEIRGDIHMELGNTAEARTAYSQALTAPGAQSLDRNALQMKLNALQPAPTAAAEPGAPAPAGTEQPLDLPPSEGGGPAEAAPPAPEAQPPAAPQPPAVPQPQGAGAGADSAESATETAEESP